MMQESSMNNFLLRLGYICNNVKKITEYKVIYRYYNKYGDFVLDEEMDCVKIHPGLYKYKYRSGEVSRWLASDDIEEGIKSEQQLICKYKLEQIREKEKVQIIPRGATITGKDITTCNFYVKVKMEWIESYEEYLEYRKYKKESKC